MKSFVFATMAMACTVQAQVSDSELKYTPSWMSLPSDQVIGKTTGIFKEMLTAKDYNGDGYTSLAEWLDYTRAPDWQNILNKYGRDAQWYLDGDCIRDSMNDWFKPQQNVYMFTVIEDALEWGKCRAIGLDVLRHISKNDEIYLTETQMAEFWRQYSQVGYENFTSDYDWLGYQLPDIVADMQNITYYIKWEVEKLPNDKQSKRFKRWFKRLFKKFVKPFKTMLGVWGLDPYDFMPNIHIVNLLLDQLTVKAAQLKNSDSLNKFIASKRDKIHMQAAQMIDITQRMIAMKPKTNN